MSLSSLDHLCERHRGESGQPGICPSCLREKLADLTADRSSKAASLDSFSSSSPGRSSSFCARAHPRRSVDGEVLRKSNSLNGGAESGRQQQQQQKKKKGFWSRLRKMTW